MDKRKRVGLIHSYNENWIGRTYYTLNLIKALNWVEDNKKPTIVLLTDSKKNVEIVKSETQYPYLDYIYFTVELKTLKRGINKAFSYFGLTPFSNLTKDPNIDLLYPNYHRNIRSSTLKKIYWVADFQEAFLPELFTEDQIQQRKSRQKQIAENGDFLVFSSKDSQGHYNDLYPVSKPEQFVLNFAVVHPNLEDYNEDLILSKYKLDQEYYFIPNQFWIHKNHITALKALKELKQQREDILFVFSGKEHDYRSKDHVQKLKAFVTEHGLENNTKFLGFIPREDQLIVLKNSLAVIQPSLFEGWSTVVEDAKAKNKFIFLSDLPVHYEQINENCAFFERLNHEDLIAKILETEIVVKEKNYDKNIEKFGYDFLEIIDKNTASNN